MGQRLQDAESMLTCTHVCCSGTITCLVAWHLAGTGVGVRETVSPHSHKCSPRFILLLASPLQTELLRVDVETASLLSAGQTVCDIWGQSRLPKNCTVCMVSQRGLACTPACLPGQSPCQL